MVYFFALLFNFIIFLYVSSKTLSFFTEFCKVYECYFKFSKKPQSYFVLRKFCVTVKLNILKNNIL